MKHAEKKESILTREDLRKEANIVLQLSIDELKGFGSLIPKAMFFMRNGKKTVFFLDFCSKEDKVKVTLEIMSFAKDSKPEAFMYVTDCFISEDRDILLSHSKNRRQAIILNCESADGGFSLLQEYEVDENGQVILGKKVESPTGVEEGLFANMLAV